MEGVRVDYCMEVEALARGLRKITRDLAEAVDRTPHTISSRHLIESALDLAEGLYNVALSLGDRCSSLNR